MAQQKESVVTPERFASGLTWKQWMAGIERNKEKFEENYRETTLSSEEIAELQALARREDGPAKLLVLGEDWCPDVYRGLPVLARIAEAAGCELRIFPRDENSDIMGEFLKDGEFQSIPTAVFYTRDHRYIAHWIERPKLANEERNLMQRIFEGRTREEAAPDYEAFQKGPVWAGWRRATVSEIIELLKEKCY
ncbi:MAG TPA: thioredoxin family protein [Dehalococcoidia bacterium]|nr:thioredoxin family protein [Dehalococcoidia bacterium]